MPSARPIQRPTQTRTTVAHNPSQHAAQPYGTAKIGSDEAGAGGSVYAAEQISAGVVEQTGVQASVTLSAQAIQQGFSQAGNQIYYTPAGGSPVLVASLQGSNLVSSGNIIGVNLSEGGTNYGTVQYKPVVTGSSLTLGYSGFQPATVTTTFPVYISGQRVGITEQGTTTFNPQTGQVSVVYPNDTVTAALNIGPQGNPAQGSLIATFQFQPSGTVNVTGSQPLIAVTSITGGTQSTAIAGSLSTGQPNLNPAAGYSQPLYTTTPTFTYLSGAIPNLNPAAGYSPPLYVTPQAQGFNLEVAGSHDYTISGSSSKLIQPAPASRTSVTVTPSLSPPTPTALGFLTYVFTEHPITNTYTTLQTAKGFPATKTTGTITENLFIEQLIGQEFVIKQNALANAGAGNPFVQFATQTVAFYGTGGALIAAPATQGVSKASLIESGEGFGIASSVAGSADIAAVARKPAFEIVASILQGTAEVTTTAKAGTLLKGIYSAKLTFQSPIQAAFGRTSSVLVTEPFSATGYSQPLYTTTPTFTYLSGAIPNLNPAAGYSPPLYVTPQAQGFNLEVAGSHDYTISGSSSKLIQPAPASRTSVTVTPSLSPPTPTALGFLTYVFTEHPITNTYTTLQTAKGFPATKTTGTITENLFIEQLIGQEFVIKQNALANAGAGNPFVQFATQTVAFYGTGGALIAAPATQGVSKASLIESGEGFGIAAITALPFAAVAAPASGAAVSAVTVGARAFVLGGISGAATTQASSLITTGKPAGLGTTIESAGLSAATSALTFGIGKYLTTPVLKNVIVVSAERTASETDIADIAAVTRNPEFEIVASRLQGTAEVTTTAKAGTLPKGIYSAKLTFQSPIQAAFGRTSSVLITEPFSATGYATGKAAISVTSTLTGAKGLSIVNSEDENITLGEAYNQRLFAAATNEYPTGGTALVKYTGATASKILPSTTEGQVVSFGAAEGGNPEEVALYKPSKGEPYKTTQAFTIGRTTATGRLAVFNLETPSGTKVTVAGGTGTFFPAGNAEGVPLRVLSISASDIPKEGGSPTAGSLPEGAAEKGGNEPLLPVPKNAALPAAQQPAAVAASLKIPTPAKAGLVAPPGTVGSVLPYSGTTIISSGGVQFMQATRPAQTVTSVGAVLSNPAEGSVFRGSSSTQVVTEPRTAKSYIPPRVSSIFGLGSIQQEGLGLGTGLGLGAGSRTGNIGKEINIPKPTKITKPGKGNVPITGNLNVNLTGNELGLATPYLTQQASQQQQIQQNPNKPAKPQTTTTTRPPPPGIPRINVPLPSAQRKNVRKTAPTPQTPPRLLGKFNYVSDFTSGVLGITGRKTLIGISRPIARRGKRR